MLSFWFCGNFQIFPPSDFYWLMSWGLPMGPSQSRPNLWLQKGLWALYIWWTPVLSSPMRPWCLLAWSLGKGPNPNMFCLALWYNGSRTVSPATPTVLCSLLPSYFPLHSVIGCEEACPDSETEPHTEEISYTWVDKLPTDVKAPLTTVPGVLELPKRGPDHGGPSEEAKQIKVGVGWGQEVARERNLAGPEYQGQVGPDCRPVPCTGGPPLVLQTQDPWLSADDTFPRPRARWSPGLALDAHPLPSCSGLSWGFLNPLWFPHSNLLSICARSNRGMLPMHCMLPIWRDRKWLFLGSHQEVHMPLHEPSGSVVSISHMQQT